MAICPKTYKQLSKNNVLGPTEAPEMVPKSHLGRFQPTAEASWSNLPATWRTRWQLAGNLAELGPNCGGFRGGLGDVWGGLGRVWGGLGESLGHLGAVLGPSWACLGAVLGHLGAVLGDLKRS